MVLLPVDLVWLECFIFIITILSLLLLLLLLLAGVAAITIIIHTHLCRLLGAFSSVVWRGAGSIHLTMER